MTQEALKKMYQLLLTEPHAPTVCAQLERIAREALADHAMQEVQRLGQEIEPDDIASILACRDMLDAQPVPPRTEQEPVAWINPDEQDARKAFHWVESEKFTSAVYTTPPQRKPLTNGEIYTAYITATNQTLRATDERLAFAFARAIEAAHGIKEGA